MTLSLALVILSSFIYIAHYLETPEGSRYLWTGVNFQDSNMYAAFSRQVDDGRWLFYNPYSAQSGEPFFFNPFMVAIGLLHRLTGIPLPLVGQLVRVLLIPVFVWSLWAFLEIFIPSERWRWLAIVLTTTSSGMGYVLVQIKPPTNIHEAFLDIHVPEAITFTSVAAFAHFVLALIFMLNAIRQYYLGILQSSRSHIAWACAFTLILGAFHPYDTIYLLVILGFWSLVMATGEDVRKRVAIVSVLALGVFAAVPILNQVLTAMYSGDMSAWMSNTRMYTPRLFNFAVSYGVVLVGALYWLVRWCRIGGWKKRRAQDLLVVIWLLAALFLPYMPVPIQRRFTMGGHIALCLLTVLTLKDYVVPSLKKSERLRPLSDSKIAAVAIIVFLSFGNVYWIRNNLSSDPTKRSRQYQPYIQEKDVEAISWAIDNVPSQTIFLSDLAMCSYLPSVASFLCPVGHSDLSSDFKRNAAGLDAFFSNASSEEEKERFLDGLKVEYFYFSSRTLKQCEWNPDEASLFSKIFDNGLAKIYKVNRY